MKWKLESVENKSDGFEWLTNSNSRYDMDFIEVKFRHPFTYNVLTDPVYLMTKPSLDAQIVQYQNGTIEYWVKDGDTDGNN